MKNLLYICMREFLIFYLRTRYFAILKENRFLKELYCYAIQFELGVTISKLFNLEMVLL
jgi:hypothetical protein